MFVQSLAGSSSAFIALHQKMITRKQVAIVRFSRGSVGMPRLAALVAQREVRAAAAPSPTAKGTTALVPNPAPDDDGDDDGDEDGV